MILHFCPPVNQALDSVLGMALQMPAMQALGKELGISLENGMAGVANGMLNAPQIDAPKAKTATAEVPENTETSDKGAA